MQLNWVLCPASRHHFQKAGLTEATQSKVVLHSLSTSFPRLKMFLKIIFQLKDNCFTDAEAEAPILWPPDMKSWLIRKDPDAGKDWRQEKGMTEDEMVGWHYWLNGHEFKQALGIGEGQRSLACCSPWGHKESDTTEWLNWTELMNKQAKEARIIQRIMG